jgi:nitroreductase
MDFDKVIEKRHSTRSFKNKAAPWKQVIEGIDAALKAPFCGSYAYIKYLMVENQKNIEKIAEAAQQTWIQEANILIIVCQDDRKLESLYGERAKMYARQQAGAAIENLMLSLTNQGVDSCWVGAFPDEQIRSIIGIPGHISIEAIIPVGFEVKKPVPKGKKREVAEAMYWETWERRRREPLFMEPPKNKNPWQ